ncbi:hypothetical protein ABTO89_18960, partial [Acinetobacter baumannii]
MEASSTPTICRLSDSRRHQLSAIARRAQGIRQGHHSRSAEVRSAVENDSRVQDCRGQGTSLFRGPQRAVYRTGQGTRPSTQC